MASTYSDRLKLELMETGANANTWGNNTNTNLETLDAFNAGYLSKSVAGSVNVTLTTANADPTAESSNKVIEFTGALTGDITVFIHAVENNYIFFNNTSGAQTLTVAPTGHGSNGVVVTQGAHTIAYCKGDTVVDLFANSLGVVSVKDTLNVTDTINVASNVTISSNGVVAATSYTGNGSGLTGVDPFEANTSMIFNQAAAPTGWTKQTGTALANTAMSIVTGTGGGTGGSDSFYSTFAGSRTTASGTLPVASLPVSGSVSGTVGGTSLSTPVIASHAHNIARPTGSPGNPGKRTLSPDGDRQFEGTIIDNAGGGGSHSHPFSGSLSSASTGSSTTGSGSFTMPAMDVKYANVIVANKD